MSSRKDRRKRSRSRSKKKSRKSDRKNKKEKKAKRNDKEKKEAKKDTHDSETTGDRGKDLHRRMNDPTAEPLFAFQKRPRPLMQGQESQSLGPPRAEPPASTKSKKGPVTKEVFEEEQKKIREVFDPATGRVRLVRGDGEILESIVTSKEQQRIQHLATRWDGVMMYGKPT